MSRKPPKLFPIEDKVSVSDNAPGEKRVPECMPPLKPGGSIPLDRPSEMTSASSATTSSSSTSGASRGTPLLRRSAPTRNFLNCNGANRRRFTATSSITPIRSHLSPVTIKPDTGSTNGCGTTTSTDETSEIAAEPPPSKVNGTISNGISSSKSNEPTRSIKRQKSLDIAEDEEDLREEDNNVSSDSHQQNSSINGRKVQSSSTNLESNNSVSSVNNSQSNSTSSSNNPSNSIAVRRRRTTASRFYPSVKFYTETSLRKSAAPRVPVVPTINTDDDDNGDRGGTNRESLADSEPSADSIPPSSEVSNSDCELLPPDPKDKDDDQNKDDQEVDGEISDTPKIIRQGDTVIKSYIDDKTGRIVVFEKGMNLEVCDFGSGKWYPAKVNNINWNKQEILVHYSNWSSRFDEWICMNNNRLRPSKNTNVVKLQYIVGEKVQAVWPCDNRKYPGTILQVLPNDMYEVLFEDDGIKMKRSENQLFKVSQDDPPAPSLEKQIDDDSLSKLKYHPPKQGRKITGPPPNRRRSLKASSAVQSSSNPKNATESSTTSSTPTLKSRTKLAAAGDSSSSSGAITLETSAPLPSRPAHFSVFDVPKEDLGKRKRSVPNYYILAKGNPRGSRRPRSEGTGGKSSAATNSAPTTDDEGAQHEDSSQETPEPVTPLPLPPSRRRKSAAIKIPSAQSSPAEPTNELPALSAPPPPPEEVSSVPPPPPPTEEKVESPRKRRQPSSSSITVTPLKVSESKSPLKSEAAVPQVADPPVASTPPVSTPTVPTRRPRSVGSVLALLPTPSPHSDAPKDTKVDSGFVDESGNPIIIEQNDGNGFWQCPLNNCGKNFRKDSLLKMHLKHYHPELKPTCSVANVVQMAQARHAFENYTSEPHSSWAKVSESTTRESSPVGKASSDISTPEVQDHHHPSHKKSLKSTPPSSQLKDASNEKISPQEKMNQKQEQDLSPSKATTERNDLLTLDPSKALSQSPRLRHKRTFVWTKSGHRKSALAVPVIAQRKHGLTTSTKDNVVIGTEGSKKSKTESVTSVEQQDFNLDQSAAVVDSPATISLSLSNSNTPSPSVISDQKSEFSIESCSGSSSSEPYLVPPSTEQESELYSSHGRARGRWGKSHIRRGLMSSGMRRSTSGMVPSAAQILVKKRIGNYRKLMRRQKRTSILSRISSGRMRVILDSLNQRSLKKKRFLATRRGRDVKVDVINCICSNKTEFGLMIQCELCLCWQHGSCFNVQTNSQLPDFYACQSCSEPEKSRLSRKYEWAESEFYKLGKLPSFPFAPSFPKEDARTMKMCTNLTSDLAESYAMIKSLKCKERICFGHPEHPQLYQWNTERAPPQEEIQRDKFNKCFQPVLRRLMLENKSDPTYPEKLKKLAETRLKLKKYSDAIESARSTIKKKLGCRAAAFLEYICESVLGEMIKHRRMSQILENGAVKKEGTTEVKKRSAETAFHRLTKVKDEIMRRQAAELKLYGSPSKSNIVSTSLKTVNIPKSQQSFMNGASVNFSMKGASPQVSNGLQKDIASNIKDFCLLKKYLKDRRTLDSSINLTISRMSKEFPEDWRNLMKLCRAFVDETSKESTEDEKMKWVSGVVVTFNNLKILLRQIFSETNGQRQKNCASEFEKATIKLFDLFGIGLTEERMERKKISPKVKNRRIRGLETLDMVADSSPNLDILKLGEIPQSLEEERSEILDRLGSTTGPITQKDCEDLLATAKQVAKFPGVLPEQTRSADWERKREGSDDFFKARGLDGRLQMEFTGSITLKEALANIPDFPLDECTEEGVELSFDEEPSTDEDPNFTGIIPVPAASRITPEVCRKNLVQDILLQQQQIDLYLDKIEGQIIKLASQSRFRGTATSSKPSDLSLQRDKMLHSLELVNRLTKTMIGENDVTPPPPPRPSTSAMDVDVSETTVTDDSSSGSSSADSDDDNTSNFSGTDTETADEGDNSGNDELLDV